MKKRYVIYGLAIAMLAGCSNGDDLLAEQPVIPADDNEHVTRQDLMGTFPIEFSGVSLGSSATVEEDSPTRGSVSSTDFSTENVGIFCLSSAKILDAASNDNVLHSWSGAVGTKLNFLNLWQNNAKAHIEQAAGNTGKIVWDDIDVARYYPGVDWFKYNFIAYHPYTEAILHSKTVLYAYMVVDGDDDVMCAVADAPHTAYNTETDVFAYSNEYYRRLTGAGVEITDDYKPYFTFKHLMASLKFNVKLKEASTGPVFHVDSICFGNFINVVRLQLAKLDGGVMSSGALTYGYSPSNLDADIQEALGTSEDKAKGSFWLREADGTSIRNKKVGNAFKYNLNETDYTEIGDCIMIPPVTENIGSANILLQVFLSDEDGHCSQAFINLNRPANGWEAGKQYNVNVKITPPSNFIGQAHGELVDWDTTPTIDISD